MGILVGFLLGVVVLGSSVAWFRAFYDAKLINKARNEQWKMDTEWANKLKVMPPPPPPICCVR